MTGSRSSVDFRLEVDLSRLEFPCLSFGGQGTNILIVVLIGTVVFSGRGFRNGDGTVRVRAVESQMAGCMGASLQKSSLSFSALNL